MRRVGLERRTAQQMVQREQTSSQAFRPLPGRPAGSLRRTGVELGLPPSSTKARAFHFISDTGGVADPNPQMAVAKAMGTDLSQHPEVAFAYHGGDAIYYEGEWRELHQQFYEPYAIYPRPIVGIPGNHDGECPSLVTFVRTFCTRQPMLLAEFEEFHRDTQTQPYCHWTLLDDAATIIGLYTNVPSGGVVKADQAAWLVGELKDAPRDKALIVALHHPPYSADAHHGGSKAMGDMLDQAFLHARRDPDLVLSGHCHNYQRFDRAVQRRGSVRHIPYIVCGAGGYHNLHSMAPGSGKGEDMGGGVTLESYQDREWGFLRLTVEYEGSQGVIIGEYLSVMREEAAGVACDKFALPVTLGS